MPMRQNSSNAASRIRVLVSSWSSATPSTAAVSAPTRTEPDPDSVTARPAAQKQTLVTYTTPVVRCLIQRCTMCFIVSGEGPMEISRRKLLVGGGVLGAAGALTVASPASAKALWTWQASGSVVGQ